MIFNPTKPLIRCLGDGKKAILSSSLSYSLLMILLVIWGFIFKQLYYKNIMSWSKGHLSLTENSTELHRYLNSSLRQSSCTKCLHKLNLHREHRRQEIFKRRQKDSRNT